MRYHPDYGGRHSCSLCAAVTARRFPPPWSIEDIGAAFVVKDSNGQKVAYVYYDEEPGRRSCSIPVCASAL